MIRETEFFAGAVLARLIYGYKSQISIKMKIDLPGTCFVLNDEVAMYIKYSTSRMSPWTFTFLESHQNAFLQLKKEFAEAFLVLVCEEDGIIVMSFEEVKKILDENHRPVEWIRAKRRKGQSYHVNGSDGQLDQTVPDSEFPAKIWRYLEKQKIKAIS